MRHTVFKGMSKKRKLSPVSTQEHLAEILRLADGEITTAAMLYWQRLSVDGLPLWEVENLKQYIYRVEIAASAVDLRNAGKDGGFDK